MIGKNNHYLRDTKDGTKVESYSIKKFKVGAASVVIGASIFLGAGAVAQASEEVSNNTTADNTTNAGAKENVPTAPVATAQPVAKETTKEDVAAGLAAKLGGEVKALDKTKLENYIAEIEGKLANGAYDNKTEESVAVLKEELKAAKATLADATTQDEITKAYSKLVTTANTKLKNKPVEKKETPAVDTTNGKETVGKKAENTEKKSESNSIENTGSKDPRNGKALDKNNAFRAETTETSGNFNYSMEYSNGKKEIYLYNEEEADVNIKVSSTAGNITKATVKAGSGQFVLKSKSDQAIAFTKFGRGSMPPEEEVETDGFGWSYRQTLTETEGPVTINITGKPNDTFKAIDSYTKTENQEAVLGSRFLQLKDSTNAELRGGRGASDPGYFKLVVKSQTYKYDIQQPESNADKIAVSNVDSPTEADITKIKNELKIKYSDKATTEDARLASKRGEVVNPRSSVVKEIAVANGTVTVTYNDDSVDTAPVSSVARTNVAPTVSIPYSDPTPDKKDIYIYNGEEVDIDITFNDDSGKIQSAALKRGGNQDLKDIGENKQDNEWGLVTTVIKNETTTPATIKITGTVTGLSDNKIPKTESQELPIVSRFATATDLDGAFIENQATKFNAGTNVVSESYKTDPGAFTITLKAQTAKYDIKTPASADKVTVSDANNISDEDFEKIKAKVKIEYSNNNIDMRLADKKGEVVDNQTERIESIEREGNNVVVTYKDGSKDTKALADFVNVAPTVEIPYSNQANKQIYVYTGENTDLTFKGTDENEVKDLYLRGPGDISKDNTTDYGFTTGKITDGTVTTGVGEVSADKRTATVKMTGKTNLAAGKEWTSFVVSKDNDGKLSNTDYRALDKDPNAKEKPGYVRFVVKNQTSKYDIATPTEKVEVANPDNVTNDELNKIKEKLQLEYSQTNDDANLADKKGTTVADKNNKIQSVTKDADGNLVVTYTDGSTDKKPLSEFVTDTTAPAKPVVDTDLTGKAGTKTPVEVSAEPGSTVELFDKDGNKIGEGTADENGKATITPTVDLPEGNVTAKATDPAGNTSDASDPAKATDTTAPAKPVVDTDLTGKAGTKTPVEVSAEPGSTVALYDKDGNKIGEATADENGKATITPTVEIPAGAVTAKATDPSGNVSEASDPATASADTEAPAKPVVNTDLTGKAGTKTPVEVTAEPGSTVALYDKDGNKIGEATADNTGKATITPTVAIPAGNVTAKATDPAGNTSDASDPMVATTDTTAPAKPVANTVKAGDTAITGTAEAGSTVEVTLPDGSKVSAKAGQDGNFSVPVSGLKEGDTVSVTATDDAGNTSAPTTATVAKADDKTAPDAPVVNTVKAGTTAVTGTAEAGSTVEVTLPDGSKVSAKADQDGNFSVPVSGLKEGDTVSVTATDDAGNTSNPTSVTVGKGTDTTAPSAPVVNPVKAGTTAVTGTAEAGSTVEVTLPDSSKVSAKADQDGNFSVPVSGLKEGDTVSVTATDDAGNTSNPTSVTVGKGTDTIAPDAPVVNTDLTGKAGTRTPIDVIAEPGSKVELFDKDGNKIGEATADETGLAVVVPTVNIPEGSVTARATDLAGNVSGASAPMFATTSGTVDSFNNGKGSENTPTVVKPSLNGKVESSTTLANHMNLKARANISSTEKDASTLPETGDEVSIGGVVLGGILAAAGLGLVGKRKKED